MAEKRSEVPAVLSRLAQRFADWRTTRSVGERIPAPLWKAAVKVAGQYGLNRTASVLSLDYYSLKKRVGHEASSAATFVELPTSPLAVPHECVIEMEDALGAKMRVQLKGQDIPDLLQLSRVFWNVD